MADRANKSNAHAQKFPFWWFFYLSPSLTFYCFHWQTKAKYKANPQIQTATPIKRAEAETKKKLKWGDRDETTKDRGTQQNLKLNQNLSGIDTD